ncbi:sensor histidine kinase [Microbacterium sp. dk485]|uniref:sensor histidine kinase n=1 Tax=Microbacterium sp. dk485 TaxID=2560021 RepID=UPI0010736400|nr:histidine kinase [Microbacterium sp. dk485]TFV85547.1 sensor histidine kinase [Microbacterium sp. dk485]
MTPAQQRTDVILAVVVFLGALLSAVLSSISGLYGDEQGEMALAVAYAFALAVPLAVRRRWPATVAAIVSVAYFAAVTLRIPELYAGNIAVFLALFTVGAWSVDRRRATIVRIAIIAGMFVWLAVVTFQDVTSPATEEALAEAGSLSPFVAFTLLTVLINVLFFGGAYYFGDRAYAQMRERRELEERTRELEREREVTAAQAVALDRVRIARELHDVVAHHVSLMGVQAGAARAVMARDPEEARRILEAVEASARESLGELRQLLATLRTPGADPEPETGPTTRGLTGLAALVEESTAAGLPATLTVVGQPAEVPDLVQLNLYRIAQEALTNARRHAGPDATADVRLRYGAGSVELEIVNTGRARPAQTGLGQVGMRERAAASGGTIEMGPRARGGYLVRVNVPLTGRVAADV